MTTIVFIKQGVQLLAAVLQAIDSICRLLDRRKK